MGKMGRCIVTHCVSGTFTVGTFGFIFSRGKQRRVCVCIDSGNYS